MGTDGFEKSKLGFEQKGAKDRKDRGLTGHGREKNFHTSVLSVLSVPSVARSEHRQRQRKYPEKQKDGRLPCGGAAIFD